MRFIFLCFVSFALGWSFFGYGTNCKFNREDAINCFRKYVDLDHDDVISIKELDQARDKYETFALKEAEAFVNSRLGRYFFGTMNITTAKVIEDCDFNHDGRFTPDDFRLATKTCLPSQFALCLLKKVCDQAAEGGKQKKKKENPWYKRI